MDKQELKKLFIELVIAGEIEFELPDALIHEGLRRSRGQLRDMLVWVMENGGFPKDKVQGMLDGRMTEYRAELKSELIKMVGERQIFRSVVQLPNGTQVRTGPQHKQFGDLLICLQAGLNTYLVGPAGSGKTTAAEQAATALEVEFFFTGAITSEFKLTGFIDANGRVICPAFRKAYEHGGLFLFDEIDGSMAQAVLAFNAAIANNMMDFPDKTVKKHEKFYCVAAANTYGSGADRIYVGRNQLDGATTDRFAFLDWGYDEELEKEFSGNDEWVKHVQKVRYVVAEHKIRHVVSPRASKDGAKLLACGMKKDKVEKLCLWKGLDKDSIQKVKDLLPETVMPNSPVMPPKKREPLLSELSVEDQVRRLSTF